MIRKDHLVTISGKAINPIDPRPSDICIEDIAAGLSKVCRYSGQIKHFLSVAEHSILVSQLIPPELAMYGLLHDAAEAYMGDVPSPVKRLCEDFTEVEYCFEAAIYDHFNLRFPTKTQAAEIKYADKEAYIQEQLGNMHYWSLTGAYEHFMKRYQEILNAQM